MIKVKCEVRAYEENGEAKYGNGDELCVDSHWNERDKVVATMKGNRLKLTFDGHDIITAVQNCGDVSLDGPHHNLEYAPARQSGGALGGGSLAAYNRVRFVYLDESGKGDPAREPDVVVGGVIIHADRQWKIVEDYLAQLADAFVPAQMRHGFVFHAMELFSGGRTFSREKYPMSVRHEILELICGIPEKFGLPVVYGYMPRHITAEFEGKRKKSDAMAQAMAAVECAVKVERFMRERAPEEVATLVHENNEDAREVVRKTHNALKDQEFSDDLDIEPMKPYLPLRQIVDTAHFAEKSDTSILQVADAIAFVMKKKLLKMPHIDRHYEAFKDQIVPLKSPFSGKAS